MCENNIKRFIKVIFIGCWVLGKLFKLSIFKFLNVYKFCLSIVLDLIIFYVMSFWWIGCMYMYSVYVNLLNLRN